MKLRRAIFANQFCWGRGIEIGALHHPFPIPEAEKIRYLDRMSVDELLIQYPELKNENLVNVDIIDDGESLKSVPDGEEDFIIAAQFIEHCQNPIRAIINMLRVVKKNGFVILTVPDKRVTFDKNRPLTTNEHLLDECINGTEKNRRAHYQEFSQFSCAQEDPSKTEAYTENLIARNYSIHFHVWDPESFLKFLFFIKEKFQLPFEINASFVNLEELIVVLKKVSP